MPAAIASSAAIGSPSEYESSANACALSSTRSFSSELDEPAERDGIGDPELRDERLQRSLMALARADDHEPHGRQAVP